MMHGSDADLRVGGHHLSLRDDVSYTSWPMGVGVSPGIDRTVINQHHSASAVHSLLSVTSFLQINAPANRNH